MSEYVSVVIVAAGSSRRMGFNKLLAPLAGVPVLRRTIAAFEKCNAVQEIIVVCGSDCEDAVKEWQRLSHKTILTVGGGTERHHSVWNGLQEVSAASEYIMVHDGARPLIQLSQIEECLSLAKRHGAAVCAHPLTETIKRADEHGAICETIDRNQVWIMETPQVFRRDLIIKAYEKVMESGELVTDEVSAMQLIQQPVYLCENREVNSKITFPSDLHYAERFLS